MGDYPSYKLIIMGDASTGKTSLINRYLYGQFDSAVQATVGVSNLHSLVKVGGETVDLKIWDTAGQEQYSALIPMFSRDSNVCILVGDYSRLETVEHIDMWIERLHKSGENPPIIVAINKTDLPGEKPIELLRAELTTKYPSVLFVSAVNGSYVSELFLSAAQLAVESQGGITPGVAVRSNNSGNGCC